MAVAYGAAMRRTLLVVLGLLVLAPPAGAATTPTRPVYDAEGRLVQTPFAPVREQPRLTESEATRIFLEHGKVADWLGRYSMRARTTDATFDAERRDWQANVWDRRARQIATGGG